MKTEWSCHLNEWAVGVLWPEDGGALYVMLLCFSLTVTW